MFEKIKNKKATDREQKKQEFFEGLDKQHLSIARDEEDMKKFKKGTERYFELKDLKNYFAGSNGMLVRFYEFCNDNAKKSKGLKTKVRLLSIAKAANNLMKSFNDFSANPISGKLINDTKPVKKISDGFYKLKKEIKKTIDTKFSKDSKLEYKSGEKSKEHQQDTTKGILSSLTAELATTRECFSENNYVSAVIRSTFFG